MQRILRNKQEPVTAMILMESATYSHKSHSGPMKHNNTHCLFQQNVSRANPNFVIY